MNYGQDEGPKKWIYDAGMGSEVELVWLYETAKKMTSIVEIGSNKGQSTHALLTGTKGIVYSIDPYLAYWELPAQGTQVYLEFINNVGCFNNLRSLRLTSKEAAKAFDDKSIDMVYIDGAHDYDNVLQDITLWLPKTIKMICGHDYYECTKRKLPYGIVKATAKVFGTKVKRGGGSIWYVEI